MPQLRHHLLHFLRVVPINHHILIVVMAEGGVEFRPRLSAHENLERRAAVLLAEG